MGECQNTACYLALVCHLRKDAEHCAIHRWFLKGEEVIQFTEEDLQEIAEHHFLEESDHFLPSQEKISHERAKKLLF